MSYARMFGTSEYNAFIEGVMREAALTGMALLQHGDIRDLRVTGALAGGDKKSREKKLLKALDVRRRGDLIRTGYFIPLLVVANILMKRCYITNQFAKLDKFKGYILHFYTTYEIFRTLTEAALVIFDVFFDLWQTMSIMGFHPPDKPEDGRMTWLSADADALDNAKKRQHAARERAKKAGQYIRPKSLPTFSESFQEARQIAEEMSEIEKQVLLREIAPDLDELSERFDKLAEYVMDVMGESRAAEDTEETSTEPREIMTPAEDESDE